MQDKISRILLLMPYFGKWPFWMPLFLKSCEYNPDIDWLLIGDCGEPEGLPPNVKYKACTFSEYCEYASSRLGLEFRPDHPYKICDLRPAFGLIHQDETEGYEFWGFGDLDLVYGDLRAYFSEEKLNRFDFFSNHARRVSGHLCLIRNTEKLRTLFWNIPDFERRIQDKKHHALDEGGFSRLFIKRKNFPKPLFNLVGWFNPLRRAAQFKEAFSTPNGKIAWLDGTHEFPEHWVWDRGDLSNTKMLGATFPYFHFLIWKTTFRDDPELTSDSYIRALAQEGKWKIDSQGFHRLT